MQLVTSAEMRAIEAQAFASGVTQPELMERAGRAVANAVAGHLTGAAARRIVVLVGPGNNGGDGLVAARYLHQFEADVRVLLLTNRPDDDPNLKALDPEIEVLRPTGMDAPIADLLRRADGVIDAVLGIGSHRPIDGVVASMLDSLADRRGLLFSVDVPTGLDADTGEVDEHTPRADYTLALGYSKLGLHLWPGSDYSGEVQVLDIGLGGALGSGIKTELLSAAWVRDIMPDRPPVSNKGTFGRVLVVAGSASYSGAAALTCLGALRSGAGLVTLAAVSSVRTAVAAQVPEITHLALPEEDGAPASGAADAVMRVLDGYDALVLGPGFGMAPGSQALARGLASAPGMEKMPLVIDADALNALSRMAEWAESLTAQAVLTPHPGEFARLASTSVPEVQGRRLAMARDQAQAWKQAVVLKGANTIVANADGGVLVSPFANALLATAGTGDVLAGAIGGFLAQGLGRFEAAALAVYLHAAAGQALSEQYGASGLLASELATQIARTSAQLRRGE